MHSPCRQIKTNPRSLYAAPDSPLFGRRSSESAPATSTRYKEVCNMCSADAETPAQAAKWMATRTPHRPHAEHSAGSDRRELRCIVASTTDSPNAATDCSSPHRSAAKTKAHLNLRFPPPGPLHRKIGVQTESLPSLRVTNSSSL